MAHPCYASGVRAVLAVWIALAAFGCGRVHFQRAPLRDGGGPPGADAGGPVPDGGGPRPDGGSVSGVSVTELRAAWATPHHLRWAWTLSGAADVASFRITVARSEADVLSGGGTASTFGPAEHPELGAGFLPETGDGDPV